MAIIYSCVYIQHHSKFHISQQNLFSIIQSFISVKTNVLRKVYLCFHCFVIVVALTASRSLTMVQTDAVCIHNGAVWNTLYLA